MDKASKIFLAGHTGLVGQQFIEEGIKISMITKKLQLKNKSFLNTSKSSFKLKFPQSC